MMATQMHADEREASPVFPRILADLEASMVETECSILDALTPNQFDLVQELVQATRLLTSARCAVAETERREQELAQEPANTCAGRPRHRARRRQHLVSLSAVAPSAARLS